MKPSVTRAIGASLAVLLLVSAVHAAPPIADYGKLPAVEQILLSPSGQKIVAIAVAHDRRLVVVKPTRGAPLFSIDSGDLKLREVAWMGEDHILLSASKTMKFQNVTPIEAFQSTIVDARTGRLTYVFQNEHKVFHATFGDYGHGAEGTRQYGYFGGLTLTGGGGSMVDFDQGNVSIEHAHIDLYKVDLDTGATRVLAAGSDVRDLAWVLDASGGVTAHASYDRKGRWRLFADPLEKALVAEAADPTGDIGLEGLGRAPGTVLVFQPTGPDNDFALLEYPAAAGSTGVALFKDEDVRDRLRDPVTGLLIGGVTNGAPPRTILFDPVQQSRFDKVARAFKGETVNLVSATSGLDKMIILTEGPGDSGTYFLADMSLNTVEAIGWAYPTILQEAVGPVKLVDYKAADGLALQGVLTLPPGREAKGLPLVVLPHGGPEARDDVRFDWWAQAFASRGYAVFQPNFRGSSGYGKAFRDAGHGQWGRKMQTDVSDGVAELARQGLIDPKRACVVGASYGGYVALAGVTVQNGLYRCAVSVGGVSDLNAMLQWEADRGGEVGGLSMRYWRQFMGAANDGDPALNPYSPRRLAARADAPVLLIFGKDDTVVSNEQSLGFARAMRAAGRPVETLELPDEDHWLSREATRVKMLEASVAFVEKHNPPN